jgi:hypothetical protein
MKPNTEAHRQLTQVVEARVLRWHMQNSPQSFALRWSLISMLIAMFFLLAALFTNSLIPGEPEVWDFMLRIAPGVTWFLLIQASIFLLAATIFITGATVLIIKVFRVKRRNAMREREAKKTGTKAPESKPITTTADSQAT